MAIIVVLQVLLFLTAYAIILNGYLRGRLKPRIDTFLGMLWVALLVACFVFFGWKMGLASIALSFVYANISSLFAKGMAQRLLGYRTGLDVREENPVYQKLMQGQITSDQLFEHLDKKKSDNKKRIAQISRGRAISELLKSEKKTSDDLVNDFAYLRAIGLGEVAWDVLSDPSLLVQMWEMRANGKSANEIAAVIMDYGL